MWKISKLSDICDISIGKTPSRSNPKFWDPNKNSKNIWLSIADLTAVNGRIISDSKEYISDKGAMLFKEVPKDTLIMSFKLTIGKLAFTGCNLWTNEAIAALYVKDKNQLDKNFLYHYLSSMDWSEISKNDIKVKGKTLNKSKLKALEINLPSIKEQKLIVDRIDKLFGEIDKAINLVKIKEREAENIKELILKKEFNNSKLNSVKIKDICDIQPPKNQVKKKLKENELVSFMPMNKLGINKMYSLAKENKKLSKVYNSYTYFENNDVLLAKITPCFENGKLGIVDKLTNGIGFGSSEFYVFRCKDNILPSFLYYFFLQSNFRKEGKSKMTGAVGHKRVPKEFIINTKIILPTISQQKLIVSKLSEVFKNLEYLKENFKKSLSNYISLKTSILSKELKSNKVI